MGCQKIAEFYHENLGEATLSLLNNKGNELREFVQFVAGIIT